MAVQQMSRTTVSTAGAADKRQRRPQALLRVASPLALLLWFVTVTSGAAQPAAIPPGVWLFDGKVALEVYTCRELLCGRILWLKYPRDNAGDPPP